MWPLTIWIGRDAFSFPETLSHLFSMPSLSRHLLTPKQMIFIACRIKSYGAVQDLSAPAVENPWTSASIMTNIVLFHHYCCHRVDPGHTLCVMLVVVWSEILRDVIWLPGRWIKPKEADAYGSDVLFWESELSGGIWEHITQSVEWYALWDLKKYHFKHVFAVSHFLFLRIYCFCFFLWPLISLCSVISAQNCSGLRTCGQCLEQPDCGWCGDPSNTGRGQCMEGSYRGPMKSPSRHSQDMVLETGLCPKERGFEWAFIQCPGEKLTLHTWPLKSKCSTRGFKLRPRDPQKAQEVLGDLRKTWQDFFFFFFLL